MTDAAWWFLEPVTPSASSTDSTPVEVPATQAAAQTGDSRAYREGRRAERAGKPLAPVAITPATETEPAAVASPDKKLSNRMQRDEDRTRSVVDKATAPLLAEIERLKTAAATPAKAAPVVAAPVAEKAPDPTDSAKYPAGEYDAKYLRDVAAFTAREAVNMDRAEAASRAESDAMLAADQAKVLSYIERVKTHLTTEPEFWSHVTTEVQTLKQFGALSEAEQQIPENLPRAVIAEEVTSSTHVAQLLKKLSAPDAEGQPNAELNRLVRGPANLSSLPAGQRVGEHSRWIIRELAKVEAQVGSVATTSPAPKTATSMPAPITQLGTRPATAADPMAAAVASGDSRTYRQLRREQRAGRK